MRAARAAAVWRAGTGDGEIGGASACRQLGFVRNRRPCIFGRNRPPDQPARGPAAAVKIRFTLARPASRRIFSIDSGAHPMPLTHLHRRRDPRPAPRRLRRARRRAAFIRLADKAARSGVPVLIEGESGTGGEALAPRHPGMRRPPGASPSCGCMRAAVREDLVAALFGIEAVTGAAAHVGQVRRGARAARCSSRRVERVARSTRRCSSCGPSRRARSSRSAARRAGADRHPGISTTNASLLEHVRQGRFREDLFYRLHVFRWPAAAAAAPRRDSRISRAPSRPASPPRRARRMRGSRPEAVALLTRYDWPGNVRQLENAVFRAVVSGRRRPN